MKKTPLRATCLVAPPSQLLRTVSIQPYPIKTVHLVFFKIFFEVPNYYNTYRDYCHNLFMIRMPGIWHINVVISLAFNNLIGCINPESSQFPTRNKLMAIPKKKAWFPFLIVKMDNQKL